MLRFGLKTVNVETSRFFVSLISIQNFPFPHSGSRSAEKDIDCAVAGSSVVILEVHQGSYTAMLVRNGTLTR